MIKTKGTPTASLLSPQHARRGEQDALRRKARLDCPAIPRMFSATLALGPAPPSPTTLRPQPALWTRPVEALGAARQP